MRLPPGFDKTMALEAAGLINQAYDQYAHFNKHAPWSLQGNYDCLVELSAKPAGLFVRKEPFGFVARNKTSGSVFVTFRGTESPDDWLSDFTFPQAAHPWGKVQDGFADIYEQCSADVRSFVPNGTASGVQTAAGVIVTGHSLGGALATLAAADLAQTSVAPRIAMYTFASPRVGDPRFAREFGTSVPQRWRIANTEDLVTSLPLATVALFRPRSFFGLRLLLASLFRKFEYEHVGAALTFTTQKGSIPANHAMTVYIDAVQTASLTTIDATTST